MKHDKFVSQVYKLSTDSKNLLLQKTEQYNPEEDCLQNFKKGSSILGITPEKTLFGYMTKHLVSISDLVESLPDSNETEIDLEVWKEKVMDTMNYLTLLWCLILEREKQGYPQIKKLKSLALNIRTTGIETKEDTMNPLNQLAHEIHQNAVAHGFWDEGTSFPTKIVLCHSELSEALEAHRNGDPVFYLGEDEKPEGEAVELIDCMIRIMDMLAFQKVDIDEIIRLKMEFNKNRPYLHGKRY